MNNKGIDDILCNSQAVDGEVFFSLEIRTKDGKIFHFSHSVTMMPVFSNMEVIDASTGNCHDVEDDWGKGFDSKTYNYPDTCWSLEGGD
jgi:hypothetical protein